MPPSGNLTLYIRGSIITEDSGQDACESRVPFIVKDILQPLREQSLPDAGGPENQTHHPSDANRPPASTVTERAPPRVTSLPHRRFRLVVSGSGRVLAFSVSVFRSLRCQDGKRRRHVREAFG